jgi:hypothetical protein
METEIILAIMVPVTICIVLVVLWIKESLKGK